MNKVAGYASGLLWLLTAPPATAIASAQPGGGEARQAQTDSARPSEAEAAVSPAVKRVKELLEAVNSGDPAIIKAYADAAAAKPGPEAVAYVLDIQRRSHGLDFVRVASVEKNGTVAVVRNRLTGDEQALALDVEPQAPHRVTVLREVPFEPAAASAPTSEKARLQQIGSYLKRLGDAEVFSGVVLIARNGKPVFERAYGYADRDKKIANTLDTPFLLGSMNKLFTGLAIGQLVEQGKLSYEDPLAKFVPDFPDPESARRIKIKHLLSHTSGLPSFDPTFSPPGDRTVTVQTILGSIRREPPRFEPGTKWSYSNTGILLLGRVIEVVTGRDYYDYVRTEVYRRGGMTRDPFPDYSRHAVAMAKPYEIEWDATRPRWASQMAITTRRGGPAGGGIASARDLLGLGSAMNAGRIVKPETLRLHASAKPELGSKHYGYAFSVHARMAERPLVGHGGNAPGQCTEFGVLTDTPYTIVVLSNLTANTCLSVTGKILQVLQPVQNRAEPGLGGARTGASEKPGTLVRIAEGTTIHMKCLGTGSPTVILTAGLGGSWEDWRQVQPQIARMTRVCAWDRPGAGLSSKSTGQETVAETTADLIAALKASRMKGPFVAVGHSLGAYETLLFKDRASRAVVGMVLVDPSIPDQVYRLNKAANRPPLTDEQMRRPLGISTKQVVNPKRDYGRMPLVVLTSTKGPEVPPGTADVAAFLAPFIPLTAEMHRGHAELAALSSRGVQRLVPDSGHYIQIDQPSAVIGAIEEVVAAARKGSRTRPGSGADTRQTH